jgi:hypothetical protein
MRAAGQWHGWPPLAERRPALSPLEWSIQDAKSSFEIADRVSASEIDGLDSRKSDGSISLQRQRG